MKNDMEFVLKAFVLIVVGIVLLAAFSVAFDIPVSISLPWDFGPF